MSNIAEGGRKVLVDHRSPVATEGRDRFGVTKNTLAAFLAAVGGIGTKRNVTATMVTGRKAQDASLWTCSGRSLGGDGVAVAVIGHASPLFAFRPAVQGVFRPMECGITLGMEVAVLHVALPDPCFAHSRYPDFNHLTAPNAAVGFSALLDLGFAQVHGVMLLDRISGFDFRSGPRGCWVWRVRSRGVRGR